MKSTLLLVSILFFATLNSCGSTQEEDNKVKIVTFGGTVTEGTSAKLDVFHDCFKWRTTEVLTV